MVVGDRVTVRTVTDTGAATRKHRAAGTVLAGVIVVTGAFASPASADSDGGKEGQPDTGPPALSIELSGDAETLRAGEEVTYTLSLTNEGDQELRGATLSQSLPDQLELVSAEGASVRDDGVVGWDVTVTPGEGVERELRVKVPENLGQTWRLASTACAQVEAGGPPVVCATDASLVDARPPEAGDAAEPVAAAGGISNAKLAGVSVVVGVVLLAIVLALGTQWRYARSSSARHQ